MNEVSLIGRLTRDPELRTTRNGTDVATLRLAVHRRRRDDGAVFVDITCFEGQARACADHLAKGRQVAISGRLELDQWKADDGTNRSRLYVIAQSDIGLTPCRGRCGGQRWALTRHPLAWRLAASALAGR
jgi:single-strand DNA-binding protein